MTVLPKNTVSVDTFSCLFCQKIFRFPTSFLFMQIELNVFLKLFSHFFWWYFKIALVVVFITYLSIILPPEYSHFLILKGGKASSHEEFLMMVSFKIELRSQERDNTHKYSLQPFYICTRNHSTHGNFTLIFFSEEKNQFIFEKVFSRCSVSHDTDQFSSQVLSSVTMCGIVVLVFNQISIQKYISKSRSGYKITVNCFQISFLYQ